jgi:hypothetical protein
MGACAGNMHERISASTIVLTGRISAYLPQSAIVKRIYSPPVTLCVHLPLLGVDAALKDAITQALAADDPTVQTGFIAAAVVCIL